MNVCDGASCCKFLDIRISSIITVIVLRKDYFFFEAVMCQKDRDLIRNQYGPWPRGYKFFFMLNSLEHENLNAHKYENINKFSIFRAQISLECYFSCS